MAGPSTLLSPPLPPKVLKSHGQEHRLERLSKNLGFGMGLEFKESSTLLAVKNEGVVRSGMIFNVCIGVQGLENAEASDPKKKVGGRV